MKKSIIPLFLILSFLMTSFSQQTFSVKEIKISSEENWYICSFCCKTKKSESAPWENGCKVSSSGTHSFQYCGKAGNYNYTCRNCDAEVYLTSSSSPSASKCCSTGGTHNWYHK